MLSNTCGFYNDRESATDLQRAAMRLAQSVRRAFEPLISACLNISQPYINTWEGRFPEPEPLPKLWKTFLWLYAKGESRYAPTKPTLAPNLKSRYAHRPREPTY